MTDVEEYDQQIAELTRRARHARAAFSQNISCLVSVWRSLQGV